LLQHKKTFVALAILTLCIAACGFEPLYVEKTSGDGLWYYNNEFDTDIVYEMSQIKVEGATDRIGQLVKNQLMDNLTPHGVPQHAKYFLKLEPISSKRKEQALRDDITATREKVKYTIKYSLWSKEKGSLVSGKSWVFLSYDLLDNPYSTTMDKKKVEEDGAKILANDISLRIGAYFHSVKTKRGSTDEL
jgi:LPS-assembly lipoprotein